MLQCIKGKEKRHFPYTGNSLVKKSAVCYNSRNKSK